MSEIGFCAAIAEQCVCTLERGHEGPHHCTTVLCGGKWEGDYNKPETFNVIQFPGESSGAGMRNLFMGWSRPGRDEEEDEKRRLMMDYVEDKYEETLERDQYEEE